MNCLTMFYNKRTLLIWGAYLFISGSAYANSGGITGYSGKQGVNCNSCHTGQSYQSNLLYNGQTTIEPNSSVSLDFVLSISAPAGVNSPHAGVNIAVSNGTLSAGSNTRLSGVEITHNGPTSISSGQLTWNFNWTAPSTEGVSTIFACSESVNRNFTNSGDDSQVACLQQQITVAASQPEPEPEPEPEPATDTRLAEIGDIPVSSPSQMAMKTVQGDFNGDGLGDVIYRHTSALDWVMHLIDSNSVTSALPVSGMSSCCGWLFNGFGDFNNDGMDDVIIRNTQSGQWYIYNLNSDSFVSRGYVPIESAIYIAVQAVADFNNDGFADVLLRNENTGEWNMTLLNNRVLQQEYLPPMSQVLTWKLVDAKDFDGNGSADILIRNETSGAWYIYLYSGTDIINRGYITTVLPTDLKEQIQGVGDFNGDGNFDLLLRNLDTNIWSLATMNGRSPTSLATIDLTDSGSWDFSSINDFDGDGTSDIIVRNKATEELFVYFIKDNAISASRYLDATIGADYNAQSLIPRTVPTDKVGTVGHETSSN